jgi:cyclophilin family peptidyl-prolyl cis-trans isomerase
VSQAKRINTLGLLAISTVTGGLVFTGCGSSSSTGSGGSTSSQSSSLPPSTTQSTTSPGSASEDTQAALDAVAVKAGCPSDPSTNLENLPSHKNLQWSSPPPMTIDTSSTYVATVVTDIGAFAITLNPMDSAAAVNSFVFLAQHHFFDCVIFHRVIPGFVIQGGDPTGTGTGGPGYEFTASGPPTGANPAQQYPLGSVAMANSNNPPTSTPNTNGSQFFIVTGTQGEQLPPYYVLFGQVTSGMSVVNTINDDGSASGVPPKITHRMLSVTISSS